MADEKNGKEVLTEEQKAAKKFLQAKMRAVRAKAVAQKEVSQSEEVCKKRQEKLREAEQTLESFEKNDDILKSLAGLETTKDEVKYRDQAASCLFELLDMIRKSDDKEKSEQEISEKTNVLPTLQEQFGKLNPAEKLFEILKNVAMYDENTKKLSIDVIELYRQIGDRLSEQNKRMDDAKAIYAELEEKAEKEAEAKRANAEKARKARKKKTTDKSAEEETATANKTATDDASSVANENNKTADSGESNNKVLEEEKAE